MSATRIGLANWSWYDQFMVNTGHAKGATNTVTLASGRSITLDNCEGEDDAWSQFERGTGGVGG